MEGTTPVYEERSMGAQAMSLFVASTTLANGLQELYGCGQVSLIPLLSSSSGDLQISIMVLSTLTRRG